MEDKLSKSYIERIEIKGLWGRFDVDWTLHPDVNILVGENGTGKSTILNLINSSYHNSIPISKNLYRKFQSIEIQYRSNNELKIEKGFCDYGTWDSKIDFPKLETGYKIIGIREDFNIPINHLSTFESKLLEKDTITKITQKNVESTLDLSLYNLETEYWKYQIELFERIVNQGVSKEKVNRNLSLFLQKINQLFKNTGKIIGQNSKDKTIIFKQNGIELSLYDLSSGEKQLLIILLTVLLQDEKPSILLLDEPEISMHLTWQYELIEIIRTLNPNCQVIIVTHSPSIFTDGWNDRVFWIEDICEPLPKLEHV
jgi:predicted ATP-binding protein involved in virulence